MEVLAGPSFGMEAAAAAATATATTTATFVIERRPEEKKIGSSCFFLKEEDVSSESSSSIGSSGNSGDEEEDGVVSSRASGSLGSLGSLEDSLPIKRGLSNHYAGKSKSFANLLDVSTVKEVEKAENPFNKRRRVLLANRWCSRSRKSSFYSWQNPNSMPLLPLNEDDEETPSSSSSSSSSNDKLAAAATIKPNKLQQSELKVTNKSQSCFSLTDLQVQVKPQ
ncbi:hypothetical protein V6N13_010593 [Hibiscus sabdariffa]|uniref:Uncharacterized protein n=2 Tax=Hibiscus sabdariffa TaxID=183260 RepID=A0ABR2NW34_9ROSI